MLGAIGDISKSAGLVPGGVNETMARAVTTQRSRSKSRSVSKAPDDQSLGVPLPSIDDEILYVLQAGLAIDPIKSRFLVTLRPKISGLFCSHLQHHACI